ncbi:MAG: FkbM family methyltransferase, partial [Synechococcus sp. SB0665_bin_28]|nr:FkbM family methyltransferase [Synechococcus sp. SB0665_bin_28]
MKKSTGPRKSTPWTTSSRLEGIPEGRLADFLRRPKIIQRIIKKIKYEARLMIGGKRALRNPLWVVQHVFSYLRIRMAEIKVIRKQGSNAPIKVNLYGHRIWVRPLSPDYAVSVDMFDQEFNQVSQCLPSNFNGLVIDAGGYIGTAAIALHEIYPQAVIVTIEPHPENFSLLEKNISGKSNIIAIKAALVASETKEDGNIVNIYDRGTGPWGFTVEENNEGKTKLLGTVDTVTLPEICNSFSETKIGIVKLDIEGSEKQLFQSNDMNILDNSFIFVELHERIMNGCD